MAKDLPERPCKNPKCKIMFKPTREWQLFHSPECRAEFYEGTTECPQCHHIFNRETAT